MANTNNDPLAQSLGKTKRTDPLTGAIGKATLSGDPLAEALGKAQTLADPLAEALRGDQGERPFISGASRFEQTLDVIGTPQQALFGALTKREDEPILKALERGARQDLRFRDVLEEAGVPPGPEIAFGITPRGVAGFAGDVVLDPALFLAGPAFKAARIGTKLGLTVSGRAIQKLSPKLAATITERVVKPVAQRFSKTAFRNPQEVRLVEIADQELGNFMRVRGESLAEASQVEKLIDRTARKANISKQEADELIGALIEEKRAAGQFLLPFERAGKGLLIARRPLSEILPGAIEDVAKRLRQIPADKADALRGIPSKELRPILREVFGPKPPTRQQEEVLRAIAKLDREQERSIRLALADAGDIVQEAKRGAKNVSVQLRLGIESPQAQLSDTAKGIITQARKETQALRGRATPELSQIALGLKQRQEGILVNEIRAGLQSVELQDARIDYLLHLMTPEAKQAVVDLPRFRNFGRQFTPAHASQLARELRGLGVREMNFLARSGNLPGFEGKIFKEFLVENPALLTATREIRAAKAVADYNVITRSAVEFGLPKGSAPSHFVELSLARSQDPRLARLAEGLTDLRFDPDVAKHLDSLIQQSALPEGLNNFVKTFDTVQGVWKSITLAIFPSYHLRNAVGNVWNNYLAGMGPGQTAFYKMAADLQKKSLASVKLGSRVYDRAELESLVKTLGIGGRGFLTGEVGRASLRTGLRQFEVRQVPVLGKFVETGFKFGGVIEDNARIAHFLWRLDKGDTPAKAALSVKRYLFDYVTGLTDFERSVMRRVFPFYAWTRFNVPLQAQALVNNPRPFVRLAEVVNTVKATEPDARLDIVDKRLIPEFIREQVGIPIRTDENGNPEYFLLGGWLPAGDLEILTRPSGPFDRAVQLLSPFIKEPIEQLTNFDLFLKRKIEEFPGEKQKVRTLLGTFNVRRRVVKVFRVIRALSEVDRLLAAAQGDELRELQSSKLGAALRTLFGLKTFTVDIGRQTFRLNRQQRELIRRLRSAGRRGDIANQEQLLDLLTEGEQE